jgi:hypothetical protein
MNQSHKAVTEMPPSSMPTPLLPMFFLLLFSKGQFSVRDDVPKTSASGSAGTTASLPVGQWSLLTSSTRFTTARPAVRHIDILIRKLRSDTHITDDESRAIERLPVTIHEVPAQTSIVRIGERPNACCLLVKGFACRSKITDTGKRQILSFHVLVTFPISRASF